MPKITETDLDRLEQYLNAPERTDATMPLDMAQGLLAAVASAPAPIPQEKWLPAVLGEGHLFTDAEEKAEITAILARFAEDTARHLNEGEGFDFILYGDDEDFGAWAGGYLAGVDLADPTWEESTDPEDLDTMLFPFLALTGEAKEMALEADEEWMSEAEEKEMLAEVREGLADHLIDIRQHWFEKRIPPTVKRDGPKVGRNDPCPCGSGKKYKSCHGK
ncbi:MAG: UPF0149 family protein [Usitatibacter sp.]